MVQPGRSSATKNLDKKHFIVSYRRPTSLKDMLVRVEIPQPSRHQSRGCNRPQTWKQCSRIPYSGVIEILHNNKTWNIIINDTCQSSNPIYFLELNQYKIRYVDQTRNRITEIPRSYFLYKTPNTTVTKHFASHENTVDPRVTIYILEYIRTLKIHLGLSL